MKRSQVTRAHALQAARLFIYDVYTCMCVRVSGGSPACGGIIGDQPSGRSIAGIDVDCVPI